MKHIKHNVRYIQPGDQCYTNGAYITWDGKKWTLDSIVEDTFFQGLIVNIPTLPAGIEDSQGRIHHKPFIESDEPSE